MSLTAMVRPSGKCITSGMMSCLASAGRLLVLGNRPNGLLYVIPYLHRFARAAAKFMSALQRDNADNADSFMRKNTKNSKNTKEY
jgi:hypothetical protein